MHNSDGRALPSYIYPIKYLHEPLLPYDSFLDNTILLISTLPILIDIKFIFNNVFFTENQDFFSIFIPCNEKKSKIFMLIFYLYNNLFDTL